MIFLAVLVVATTLSTATARLLRTATGPRARARTGLALALTVAGASHLLRPLPFEQHLPEWVPAAGVLVAATGVLEIALGVGLLAARSRRRSVGRAIAAYLVAVWPANLHVAIADVDVDGQPGGAYPWIRVPVQALFVAWALWSTTDDTPATHPDPPTRTVMASELCLNRFRDVPGFMVAALGLRRRFRRVPGGLRLRLRAAPGRRRFWTLSEWTDEASLLCYVGDPAHAAVMRRYRRRMSGSAFVTWTSPAGVPVTWAAARRRLAEAAPAAGPTPGPNPDTVADPAPDTVAGTASRAATSEDRHADR